MTDTNLPDPMTPADCNLRGLPFMPLQVVQLLDSDLFIKSTGDEFKAAVALWCKSWNQIPGGSLPDDDQVLEALSCSKAWKKVRVMAMRGWVKCSDGRLYHPVVAQNAIQAWESREEHREVVDNKNERQKRWRARIKDVAERLRLVGVTLPLNPTLSELERLTNLHLVDKSASTKASTESPTETSHGDGPETAYKGKGKGQVRKKGAKAPLSAASMPTWMQQLVAIYHEILPELPGVRVMDKERDQALRDFWDWVLKTNRPDGTPRATNTEEALAWARDFFRMARNNDFIMGRTTPSPGHENWRCSIEYLLSSKGMKKVIEQTAEKAVLEEEMA